MAERARGGRLFRNGFALVNLLLEISGRDASRAMNAGLDHDAQHYAENLVRHMQGRNPGKRQIMPDEVEKLTVIVRNDIIARNHEVKGE